MASKEFFPLANEVDYLIAFLLGHISREQAITMALEAGVEIEPSQLVETVEHGAVVETSLLSLLNYSHFLS